MISTTLLVGWLMGAVSLPLALISSDADSDVLSWLSIAWSVASVVLVCVGLVQMARR